MIEQNSPNGMAASLKAGDEISIFAAILFHHILHDGGDAIHIEVEWARVLNPIPHGIGVMIGRHTAVTGASIRYDQRRDEDEGSRRTRLREGSGGFKKLPVCTFDHHDYRPFLPRGPTLRQREIIFNGMTRGSLQLWWFRRMNPR